MRAADLRDGNGVVPVTTAAGSLPSEILELIHARPAWQADARCREFPDVDFFPERGAATEPAKVVCEGCAVRSECLDFAVSSGEKYGVWGATSAVQRRSLRRRAA